MAGAYVKQCDVSMQPHLSTKVVRRRASSPQGVLAFSKAHTIWSTRGRESGSSELKSGRLLLRTSEGAAADRASHARRSVKCEAATGRREQVENYSYDLYELLGVEKGARAEEIKQAYRWLQKKCHPDIAGPRGHDMAILLNDAYAVLSDPDRRADYDSTCAENAQFAGFTGEPLYSKWYGRLGEDRAVFVEESRCIGCLKCAFIAPNTFAIEARYGRARAVNQWLDEEGTVKDAIRACPVDCISWVDRQLLPALEFVMSKQPRLVVGVNNYSYVGVRQENVFEGARRFLEKYTKRRESETSGSQETSAQREARMVAAEGIHIKAGRWWHDLMDKQGLSDVNFTNLWDPTSTRIAEGALIPVSSLRKSGNNQFVDKNSPEKFSFDLDADLGPLLEAARQRRRRGTTGSAKVLDAISEEEYWIPTEYDVSVSSPLPVYSVEESTPAPEPAKTVKSSRMFNPLHQSSGNVNFEGNIHIGLKNLISTVPALVSVIAAVHVGMNGGSDVALSETDVVTGPLPTSLTSGVVMQMFLTAVVWYLIGAVVCAGAVFMTTAFIGFRGKRNED